MVSSVDDRQVQRTSSEVQSADDHAPTVAFGATAFKHQTSPIKLVRSKYPLSGKNELAGHRTAS